METLSSLKMTMVTLCAECYCSMLSLWQPFFAKGFRYFAKASSFYMKMPGVIHPTGLTAVHLIGYGSVPILRWVFYLSLHPWEVPGWPVTAIDGDVKQVITSWLQTLDSSVFTLEYKPWFYWEGDRGCTVVKVLRYKSEGRWFDSRWCHWNFSLT